MHALASAVDPKMMQDPDLVSAVAPIIRLIEPVVITASKYNPTPDMSLPGQEVIKVAFADEDKPGKVARRVLELFADVLKRAMQPLFARQSLLPF